MKKPHLPITIVTCIALSLSLATTAQPDDAGKRGIRDVQQVLKDCGFSPGPIDGVWGNQTTTAAKSFLQAHGEPSASENTTILMTQVDSYRIGDDGPCPDKVADVADQIQEEAGKPGKPVDAVVDVTDQAQEGEVKDNKTELIAEVKRTMERSMNYTSAQRYYGKRCKGEFPVHVKAEIKILEDRIRYSFSSDDSAMLECVRRDGVSTDIVATTSEEIKFIDIGSVFADPENSWGGLRITCRQKKNENETHRCTSSTRHRTTGESKTYEVPHLSIPWRADQLKIWANPFDQKTAHNNAKAAAAALENLIAYYDNNGNQSTGQPPSKCYEWVSLGEFNIGKWINSNGRETGSLPVGSDRKFYDRDELETDYKDYHSNCKSSAESALDNAINAMILVGRYTDDIEDERKRIRAFYQGNLDKCQAHFKGLWEKYEGKFCE